MIERCGEVSTQVDARSPLEDYNYNCGERCSSKTRMRYLPGIPLLVAHPFFKLQKIM
jgi:hypothetical protein